MKKILTIGICFMMLLLCIQPLSAKEDTLSDDAKYHVVNVTKDGTTEIIKTYDSYGEAKVSHTLLKNQYNNLGITYGTSFLTIEYGVVGFEKADDCSFNVEYRNDANGKDGYTNGCYGADAAFLEYNYGDNQVKFMLSGVIGWAEGKDVTIYPIEQVSKSSTYSVKDGYLYHHISSDIHALDYDTSVKLEKDVSGLSEGKTYYSYDGHYFYEDFRKMINDYRDDTHKQSKNKDSPFYNYFQYISQRTTSNYQKEDLDAYFKDQLAINHSITSFYDKDNQIHDILTQSNLPQAISAFLQYQNQYGANALLNLGLSMNESATGKSVLAYQRNNLFGHAAYDSDVEKNASRYQSINASVYAHDVQYISKSYTNPDEFPYAGGFFGDKSAGMNVKYASDPYWGEKAAQYAMEIDEALGGKDQSQYALGISNQKEISVYTSADTKSKKLYTIEKGATFSFVLLEEIKNKDGQWYRVQSDIALNKDRKRVNDGTYSFKDSYGYIKAENIQTIIHPKQLSDVNYIDITFDANGGTFYPDQKSVTLQVKNGIIPSVTTPIKVHALFKGWDKEVQAATETTTYRAVYDQVKDVTISKKPKTKYTYQELLDVKDGMLSITFENGDKKEVAIESEMVSGYDSKKTGKQVLDITYAGYTIHYEIEVDKDSQKKNETLSSTADEIIKNYAGKRDLSEESMEQLEQFQKDMRGADVNIFTAAQIRMLDQIFQENLHPSYSVVIKDKSHDLAVSGLSLAIQDESFLNHLFPKTIILQVKDTIGKEQKALVEKVADANYVRLDECFTISGKNDFGSLQGKSEMLFSIQKPKEHNYRQYRIYYIDGEDVYQLPTSQTKDRIIFQSEHIGSFAIVSTTNTRLQESDNIIENNSIKTNGTNYIMRYLIVPCVILLILLSLYIALRIYMKKHRLQFRWKKNKKRKKLTRGERHEKK
ncbi:MULTISPECIES: glucosaminidase domain-containing protein [Erysipelotrichaceae]|uniref:Glucosaminidase domain-containing protein n=1 Tax=Amedibacillus hominis TaxID=2897776 RepID=A0ABS9R6N2_9FIRM|nr:MULTISPECIES: glucosaminidase domain-containing protein [Erysipelotrichaceae]MCH4285338.1 glucosaminidase domain-containing protein [Amedibacillus hominis]